MSYIFMPPEYEVFSGHSVGFYYSPSVNGTFWAGVTGLSHLGLLCWPLLRVLENTPFATRPLALEYCTVLVLPRPCNAGAREVVLAQYRNCFSGRPTKINYSLTLLVGTCAPLPYSRIRTCLIFLWTCIVIP